MQNWYGRSKRLRSSLQEVKCFPHSGGGFDGKGGSVENTFSLALEACFLPKRSTRSTPASTYLEVGRWMHAHGYTVAHRVNHRTKLFDLVGRRVADRVVLYMEFGVYQGAATRYWSNLLHNPESKLHGFDSFEGMPETWVRPDGHFSVGGQLPQIDDARVQFFKGWFSETLTIPVPKLRGISGYTRCGPIFVHEFCFDCA